MKKRSIWLFAMFFTASILLAGCKKEEQAVVAEEVELAQEAEVTEVSTPIPTVTITVTPIPTPTQTPEPTKEEEPEKEVVSPIEMEEEKKVTSPVEENIVIDPAIAADELGKNEENMLAVMDSLNMCMAEQGYTYDVNNAEFFWMTLAYTIGNYPNLRDNESNGTLKYNEEGYYEVYYKLVQEYAAGIFADYSALPELPENGIVSQGTDGEYYHFYAGDRGDSYGSLLSWKNNGDGSYTAVTQLQSRQDNSVIATYEYVLVKNSYANDIAEPMFVYAVKSVKEK